MRLREARQRIQRDLQQYGFWKSNIRQRLFRDPSMPRVLANSIPKSGTNLLLRILYLMPGLYRKPWRTVTQERRARFMARIDRVRAGEVVAAHLYYDSSVDESTYRAGFKRVIMIRDPRDVVVSRARYVLRDRRHPLHNHFRGLKSDHQRIMVAICGCEGAVADPGDWARDIGWRLDQYLSWADTDDCLVVRYEDLVGVHGGGSRERQHASLRDLADHLQLPYDHVPLVRIMKHAYFRGSRTFSKGRAGSWREHFDDELIAAFKRVAGQQLIKSGYESNGAW